MLLENIKKMEKIKNNKDYQKTLELINNLWDAKINTPEGDKLNNLVTLIENYEDKEFSILI